MHLGIQQIPKVDLQIILNYQHSTKSTFEKR
jgi:hypothetical protein